MLPLFSLTLDQAIDQAMQTSPLIKKSEAQARYTQTNETVSRAGYLPTVDAGFQWKDVDETTAFGFSPTHYYTLSAKYNLFRGFSDQAGIESASHETTSSQLMLEATRSDIRLSVISAFTACLKAHKRVKTQEDELESLQRSYDDTKVRFEQGMIAKNELLLIDTNRLAAEQALFSAKSSVLRAYSLLSSVIGTDVDPGSAEELTAGVDDPARYEVLLESAFANRSELQALNAGRLSLVAQHKGAAANYYPSVDLQGDYRLNDKERYAGTTLVQVEDQSTVTVNVTWNLYNGGSDQATRQGVMEKLSMHDEEIAATRLSIKHQLYEAYEAYFVAKNALDVARRAQESAQENFRITKDRYEFGQVDSLTLLVAQSNLTTSTNALNNARYDLYTAKATIDRISGK
jgi:outer membrane protein TolC